MARTLSFDRDGVVRGARAVFWASGYENASIPDLETSTGLSRSSIYNSFGSKRGLFDAAVQSYLDEIIRPRLRSLTVEPVHPEAITDYLTGLRDAFRDSHSLPASHGCLLINAAGAPIANDAHVAQVIADYRAELYAAVSRGIAAGLPTLDSPTRSRLSDTVTGLVIAAFALARIDPTHAAHSLETALGVLAEHSAASISP